MFYRALKLIADHHKRYVSFVRQHTLAAVIALLATSGAITVAQGVIGAFQPGVPTGPSVFGVADPTAGVYFGTKRVGVAGHFESGLTGTPTTPVLSACGTTPALAAGSTDTAGTVTMGTTATGCVITFGTAYTAAPSCVVSWVATPLASQSYVTAVGSITTTQTSTSNNVLNYFCTAKSGG